MTASTIPYRVKGGLTLIDVPSKFKNGDGRPAVALDIDGTLGDYHAHFLWFAERWLGRPMPDPSHLNPALRLSEFIGVPHREYQECKLAYRQGGLKRWMPVYPYASELTQNIRNAGAELWICTTRPYLRLDNIDPDTREWLRRNRIEYDGVIFSGIEEDEKYPELVRQVGQDRIVCATDDLPEQVDSANKAGIDKVYVRDQPYNREDPDGKPLSELAHATRVYTLQSLWFYIARDLQNWRGRHA